MVETPTKPHTFHKFGDLPQELKDMIWASAADARPSAPGAHIFHVHGAKDGRLAPKGEDVHFISSNADSAIVPETEIVISIPRRVPLSHATTGERAAHECPGLDQEGRECQWMRNQNDHRLITHGMPNPSMYLIYGGLWSACRDSCWAMEKRFRSNGFELPIEESDGSGLLSWEVADMPATGYIILCSRKAILGQPELGVRVEPWFLAVFPQRDLFIFSLEDVFAEQCEIPLDWFKTTSILSLNSSSTARDWGHSSGFRNIAFTWDPSWDYKHHIFTGRLLNGETALFGKHKMAEGLLAIVDRLEGKRDEPPQKVWIINHRIKRKQLTTQEMEQYQAVMEVEEEVIFYGADRKYTAVQFRGGDQELPIPWEGDREWCRWSTPAELIRTLGNYSQPLEDQIEEWLTDHGVLCDCRMPEFGLLACEMFDESSTAPH